MSDISALQSIMADQIAELKAERDAAKEAHEWWQRTAEYWKEQHDSYYGLWRGSRLAEKQATDEVVDMKAENARLIEERDSFRQDSLQDFAENARMNDWINEVGGILLDEKEDERDDRLGLMIGALTGLIVQRDNAEVENARLKAKIDEARAWGVGNDRECYCDQHQNGTGCGLLAILEETP